ncbi:MAG TPA: hypothetical protein VF861_09380 [Telluria sp.]
MIALSANAARLTLTVIALVLELAHLGWTYFHGGVPSHHLLNRADLPAISNWWGAVLIPALTWFLVGRIQLGFTRPDADRPARSHRVTPVLAGFLCALAYGAALAIAFTMQSAAVTYIFFGLFAISLLVPTYRAEYVLGFVLGMSFTFGAVLPTAVASVVALFSGLVHFLLFRIRRLVQNRRAPPAAAG